MHLGHMSWSTITGNVDPAGSLVQQHDERIRWARRSLARYDLQAILGSTLDSVLKPNAPESPDEASPGGFTHEEAAQCP